MVQIIATSRTFQVEFPDTEVKKRMVPKDETTIVPDRSKRFIACFTKYCCCCFSCCSNSAQNQNASRIFAKYLDQEYGNLASLLAQRLADINLDKRRRDGTPFYSSEGLSLINRANTVHANLDSLKKMMKHYAFYQEWQLIKQETKGSSEKNPVEPELTIVPDLSRKKSINFSLCTVVKGDNSYEQFKQQKIEDTVLQLPLVSQPSQKEAHTIASNVKKRLIQEAVGQVSSSILRNYIANELLLQGFSIKRPDFLDLITFPPLAESIAKKRTLQELIAPEVGVLLEQIQLYNEMALSEYPEIKQVENLKLEINDQQ